jgi:hypothetical protein
MHTNREPARGVFSVTLVNSNVIIRDSVGVRVVIVHLNSKLSGN